MVTTPTPRATIMMMKMVELIPSSSPAQVQKTEFRRVPGQREPLPSPAYHTHFSVSPSLRPLEFFFSPGLSKNPKPLGDFYPGPGSRRSTVTLNQDGNVFADRAQLVSGCAAVGSRVVLGCLLWNVKVEDYSIPGTHQRWSWVSFWDAPKHLLCSFHPCLVARTIRFL